MPNVRVKWSPRSPRSADHGGHLPSGPHQWRVDRPVAAKPHPGRQTPARRGYGAPIANLQARQAPPQSYFSADGLQGFGQFRARPILAPVRGALHTPQGAVGPRSPRRHIRLRLAEGVGHGARLPPSSLARPPDFRRTAAGSSLAVRWTVGGRCGDRLGRVLRCCAPCCGVPRLVRQPRQSRRHLRAQRLPRRCAASRGRRQWPTLLWRSASRSPARRGASSLLLRSCVR